MYSKDLNSPEIDKKIASTKKLMNNSSSRSNTMESDQRCVSSDSASENPSVSEIKS